MTIPQVAAPDRYDLSGYGITVSYIPSDLDGQPTFTYEDDQRALTFRGHEIRRVEVPDLGTVVSVTLVMSVDSGSTTFSVLLPRVIGVPHQYAASVSLKTEGISAIHTLFSDPTPTQGQGDIYTVTRLRGVASVATAPLAAT
jgi:hypothetical protein